MGLSSVLRRPEVACDLLLDIVPIQAGQRRKAFEELELRQERSVAVEGDLRATAPMPS